MKTWELISIICSALVAGMFYGPWTALSRSMRTFTPEVFLAVVDRMNRNTAPVMTVLMPAALLAMMPVLVGSIGTHRRVFALYAAALVLFLVAMAVTVLVEVPIVKEIVTWTVATLPAKAGATGPLDEISCSSRCCWSRESGSHGARGDLLNESSKVHDDAV